MPVAAGAPRRGPRRARAIVSAASSSGVGRRAGFDDAVFGATVFGAAVLGVATLEAMTLGAAPFAAMALTAVSFAAAALGAETLWEGAFRLAFAAGILGAAALESDGKAEGFAVGGFGIRPLPLALGSASPTGWAFARRLFLRLPDVSMSMFPLSLSCRFETTRKCGARPASHSVPPEFGAEIHLICCHDCRYVPAAWSDASRGSMERRFPPAQFGRLPHQRSRWVRPRAWPKADTRRKSAMDRVSVSSGEKQPHRSPSKSPGRAVVRWARGGVGVTAGGCREPAETRLRTRAKCRDRGWLANKKPNFSHAPSAARGRKVKISRVPPRACSVPDEFGRAPQRSAFVPGESRRAPARPASSPAADTVPETRTATRRWVGNRVSVRARWRNPERRPSGVLEGSVPPVCSVVPAGP